MKAISIKQPWAWLIANGYKTVENRKWYTAHRGDLLIHASKSKEDLERDLEYVRQTFGIGIDPDQLIFGQVLAVADLIACTKEPKERIDQYWHDKGNFAWILRKIRQIDPFVVRGRLNLFEIPFSWDEYPEQIREPLPEGILIPRVEATIDEVSDEPAYIRRERESVQNG
jgi:hypothetical protein